MPAALRHETTVGLRWRDIDTLGHLNQSVYHELLEEARIGLFSELARRAGAQRTHGVMVVRHVDLDYHHEVRRDDDVVTVSAEIAKVGTSSITITQEIHLPDGTLAASGAAVLVGWDPGTRGKRVLSEAERAALGAEPPPPSTQA
jgi:acyl-CoA thioester hydrolase